MATARRSTSKDRTTTFPAPASYPLARRLIAACVAVVCSEVVTSLAWAQAGRSVDAAGGPSASPSTQGPTQAELDSGDVDPASWLTSNKGYMGYRYSKLDQINAQNIDGVGQVCAYKLGEQGSFQGAPLVYDGVLYFTTGLGTYAIHAANCRALWAYQHRPGPFMGQHNNKGAAIAAGRVIRGTPDGHLIALDAKTGALLWDREVMDASGGEYATAAPLIWNETVYLGRRAAILESAVK
jgi:alcohol dehydrogenase (cytochrome c)